MADIFDQATEREEQERERAIAAARKPVSVLPFTGCCHNCGAHVAPSMRFCNAECCEDFERRAKARARQ
jgi:putative NADPH-quinone reductase